MADLAVTIGADTTELEKKAKSAGKTLEKELGKGGKGVMKGVDFASNLMSGNVGAAVGGLFGPLGAAIGGFVDDVVKKAKELIDKAIELRALSFQTNLSPQQIQGLEPIAKATGISIGKLADNMTEYNRRLGYAQMHGGEMNVLLNKMGVSFDQIKNRSFTYFDAINALSKAQAAGTDEATLNHYANVMLGSSYKELLPLIKIGSSNLKLYAEQTKKTSQESIDALTETGDAWNLFIQNVENTTMDLLGKFLKWAGKDASQVSKELQLISMNKNYDTPQKVISQMLKQLGPMRPDKARTLVEQGIEINKTTSYGKPISNERAKELLDALYQQIPKPGTGNKLNPFGSELAQGASQMQAMGGGDLFGAVTFNPQKEIANNTKVAAEQITQLNSKVQPSTTANPQREGLEK
jgi:hypothetical protein